MSRPTQGAKRLLPLLGRLAASSGTASPCASPVLAALKVSGLSSNAVSFAAQTNPAVCLGGGFRAFAASGAQEALANINEVSSLLQQVEVLRLREALEEQAEKSLHIPQSQLLAMILDSGAAANDKEAFELALALNKAGVVLVVGTTVYLRPTEIAEAVMQVLPGGRQDEQTKLESVERELSELDNLHAQVERDAHRVSNRFMLGGFLILFTQFAAFVRLTYWELSWDVMEPIAYMISLFYSLVGYTYFLATRGAVFDLQPFKQFWFARYKHQRAQKVAFNQDRYLHLLRLRERYKKHLAHARIQA